MDPHLVTLAAAALEGLVSRQHERHGVAARTPEDLGREAAQLALATLVALEDTLAEKARADQATAPEPARPRKAR